MKASTEATTFSLLEVPAHLGHGVARLHLEGHLAGAGPGVVLGRAELVRMKSTPLVTTK